MERIRARGFPLARGRQYGAAAAARIRRSIECYDDAFRLRAGLDWATAVTRARAFLPAIESFAPACLQEMCGIAEGAGVDFDAILVLNCRSELMFAGARAQGGVPPGECTSFAVTPQASANGHTLLGQNWDWVPFARDLCVLLDMKRDDGPDYVTIVEAGMLAKVGVNAAGLGLCTNTLVSHADAGRAGVPYHVMLRVLLDATSVQDASRLLHSAERALSANYLVADKRGNAANFETVGGGAAEIRATRPERGVIAHSNHFLAPEWQAGDAYLAGSPHSVTRLDDLRNGLRAAELSVPRLQSILRMHDHAPNGVCSHPDPSAHPLYARCTVSSVIADLTAGELWYTDGPPCANTYTTLQFTPSLEST